MWPDLTTRSLVGSGHVWSPATIDGLWRKTPCRMDSPGVTLLVLLEGILTGTCSVMRRVELVISMLAWTVRTSWFR
jgi:hypothetical protein